MNLSSYFDLDKQQTDCFTSFAMTNYQTHRHYEEARRSNLINYSFYFDLGKQQTDCFVPRNDVIF